MKRKKTSSDFEQYIADRLTAAGIPFRRGVHSGGLRADFVVSTPKGRSILIETLRTITTLGEGFVRPAQTWGEGFGRLRNRVNYYKQATGADRVLFVAQGLKSSQPENGLVSEKDLVSTVAGEIDAETRGLSKDAVLSWREGVRHKSKPPEGATIFAAMPFAPQYEDTFFWGMVPAAKSVGAVCVRVDQEKFQGDVVAEISRLIRESKAMIVDVSEPNPNVFFEAGYGYALRLPIVQISSSPTDQLPFDIRNMNTIKYTKGQTHKLRRPLSDHLKVIFGAGRKVLSQSK